MAVENDWWWLINDHSWLMIVMDKHFWEGSTHPWNQSRIRNILLRQNRWQWSNQSSWQLLFRVTFIQFVLFRTIRCCQTVQDWAYTWSLMYPKQTQSCSTWEGCFSTQYGCVKLKHPCNIQPFSLRSMPCIIVHPHCAAQWPQAIIEEKPGDGFAAAGFRFLDEPI